MFEPAEGHLYMYIYSFTHVLDYSCTHVLMYSCTSVLLYSCTHWCTRSFTCTCTRTFQRYMCMYVYISKVHVHVPLKCTCPPRGAPSTRLASFDKSSNRWQDQHPLTRQEPFWKDEHPLTRQVSVDKNNVSNLWQDSQLFTRQRTLPWLPPEIRAFDFSTNYKRRPSDKT